MMAVSEYLRRQTKAPLTDLAKTRRTAWGLSLAGFLPFAGLSLALWLLLPSNGYFPFVIDALTTYAAVILSFLGGIRWGLVLRSASDASSRNELVFSILPALVGWISLLLAAPYVFAVHALAFAAHGAWDSVSGEKGAFGLWFVRLRTVLTFLVTGSLIAAFFATV